MNDEPARIEPEFEVRDADTHRIIQALNDQARELLIHPPFAINMIGSTSIGQLGFIWEFQRTKGVALDAVVVELDWDQMQFIRTFIDQHLGDMDEATALRKLYESNEGDKHDPEA